MRNRYSAPWAWRVVGSPTSPPTLQQGPRSTPGSARFSLASTLYYILKKKPFQSKNRGGIIGIENWVLVGL